VNGHEGTGRPDPERLSEAWRSGDASSLSPEEWIDYAAAGMEGPQQLSGRLAEVLEIVELRVDIARLGLRNRLPADLPEEVGPRVLAARARFRERLAEGGDEDYFETFDPERYSDYASLIENLVFGIPLPEALMGNSLAERPQMREVLKQTGLDVMLFDMGRQIAETLIEIFGDLSPDNPLMESVDLMSPDEVDDYRTALRRTSGEGPYSGKYRRAFQELAFGYIEPKHRLGLLDDRIRSAVLAARARFREKLEPDLSQAVSVHSPTALNPAASFQDNVLFGRVVDRYAEAAARINEVLVATLYDTGLAEVVFEIGLDFDIGSGAKRLSAGQQQKLALARALLKRPDLLVLNRPLSALDGDSQQATIGRVLASREALGVPRQTVFWVLSHAEHAHFFDRTLEFRDGRMTMIDAHVPHPVDEPA
jgi:putative ABC transport system ATP-binding protein